MKSINDTEPTNSLEEDSKNHNSFSAEVNPEAKLSNLSLHHTEFLERPLILLIFTSHQRSMREESNNI